jgi:dienelactone hydrolase
VLLKFLSIFSLGSTAWVGAAYSLLAISAIVWFGILISVPPSSIHGWLTTLGFAVGAGAASLLLGNLIVSLLSQFQRIPELYRWILISTVFLLFNLLKPSIHMITNVVGVILFIVLTASLFGAGMVSLKRKGYVAIGAVLVGGVGILACILWFIWDGPKYSLPQCTAESSRITQLALDDPSQPGPYSVRILTYGSGGDRHRSEYGTAASIQTKTVDVSKMVTGGGGITGWLRRSFWGFDFSNVPLNGRVWYPDGDGPFPLVLIVHGNHSMDDFSDPGYDYLGELLASRGFIISSIDENFLNGAGVLESVFGGVRNENDARGYLLLEHLSLWHQWNQTEDHVFQHMVDTDNIALIGHSRGGEAVAIAAAFNGLPAHPDNAELRFGYGFNIKAIIAIAPSDGQYRPRQQGTPLENINYLVLQGVADSDVRSFIGANQYDRVSFTDEGDYFKAALYVYGANHGQFNTTWGRVDLNASLWFLNRGEIMPRNEQETVAEVFISSFLEATMHGQRGYEVLFENPLSGRNWLPTSVYLSQYQSSDSQIVCNFQEDLNLETTTMPGGLLTGVNLITWREEPLTLGNSCLRHTISVHLSWNHAEKGVATYSLQFPNGFPFRESDVLTFALANASNGQEPIDFTIRIVDKEGQEASLPLSHIMPLPPVLEYRIFKPPLQVTFEDEPAFTTYGFILKDFTIQNNAMDLNNVIEVSFVFDRTPKGTIFIDDIGFYPNFPAKL